jgi:membrane associated rhomboid family serine protease
MQQKSWLSDLWHQAFKSGNPLYRLMGIQILVFVLFKFLYLVVWLSGSGAETYQTLLSYAILPNQASQVLFQPWAVLTYGFIHLDFFHILFNLLWLYWMGQIFLAFLQKRQFNFLFLSGVIMGALLYLLTVMLFGDHPRLSLGLGLMGSSAGVSAIIVGIATLIPNYSLRLLLFGNVPLKYLALAYIVLDILALSGGNAGGNIAHLGGALWGFLCISALKKGNDWSKFLQRKPKSPLKVVRNPQQTPRSSSAQTDQETIDRILDKISKTGYEGLSAAEKEALFKASKTHKPNDSKK